MYHAHVATPVLLRPIFMQPGLLNSRPFSRLRRSLRWYRAGFAGDAIQIRRILGNGGVHCQRSWYGIEVGTTPWRRPVIHHVPSLESVDATGAMTFARALLQGKRSRYLNGIARKTCTNFPTRAPQA